MNEWNSFTSPCINNICQLLKHTYLVRMRTDDRVHIKPVKRTSIQFLMVPLDVLADSFLTRTKCVWKKSHWTPRSFCPYLYTVRCLCSSLLLFSLAIFYLSIFYISIFQNLYFYFYILQFCWYLHCSKLWELTHPCTYIEMMIYHIQNSDTCCNYSKFSHTYNTRDIRPGKCPKYSILQLSLPKNGHENKTNEHTDEK